MHSSHSWVGCSDLGKICRSPNTKPFSRGLLKSKLQENKGLRQKCQAQEEIMELLMFQPPLQIFSMVARLMRKLCFSRPPCCSCSAFMVPLSMGAHAQPSHNQDDPPRHQLSWPRLQDITIPRNSVNFAMKSAATDQSPTLDDIFAFCRHNFQDEILSIF